MQKFRRIFGMLAGMLFPLCSFAQLTLDDCQRLAQQNYPLLKKYDLIRQTTDYTVKNIRQGYLPRLAVIGQVTLQNDVPTLPGTLQEMLERQGREVKGMKKDQYRIGVDVDQLVWDGGHSRAHRHLAEAQGQVDEVANDVQLYALRSRVNELYFGLLWLEEQIAQGHNHEYLLQRNLERLDTLLQRGVAVGSDVDAFKAEWLTARQQCRSLEDVRDNFRQVLALYVARQPDELKVLQKPEAILLQTMDNSRPEMQLFDAQKAQTEARRKMLDRALYPHISIFAKGGYGYPGYDFFDDMFDHKWKWTATLGLRVRWDLSNFYTLSAERKKIVLAGQHIDNAREVFLFNNRLQATRQQSEMQRYRKMMADDREIIRLRQSVREAAESKLEHGIIDVVQLLQEITRENQARIDCSCHEIEMLKHLYELKYTLNR